MKRTSTTAYKVWRNCVCPNFVNWSQPNKNLDMIMRESIRGAQKSIWWRYIVDKCWTTKALSSVINASTQIWSTMIYSIIVIGASTIVVGRVLWLMPKFSKPKTISLCMNAKCEDKEQKRVIIGFVVGGNCRVAVSLVSPTPGKLSTFRVGNAINATLTYASSAVWSTGMLTSMPWRTLNGINI